MKSGVYLKEKEKKKRIKELHDKLGIHWVIFNQFYSHAEVELENKIYLHLCMYMHCPNFTCTR